MTVGEILTPLLETGRPEAKVSNYMEDLNKKIF